ncbi:MAG TPA: SGNH/GDSL hydrolase family protein, partial [Myxococcota bacterium]|nr:SGNH/GDSL hydrolase family protein [Myxococcota bacterium]
VEQEKIYASVLGKELGTSWEVLNAGIGAWTLWQSWVRLAWDGERLAPDVVMAYHQANDYLPAGQIDRNNPLYFLPGTDRQIYESRRPWAPILRILDYSRAWRVGMKSWTEKQSLEGSTPTLRVPDPDRRLAWQSMARWCSEHQAQLWVVVPLYDSNRIDPVLRATAALPGVKLVDLPALAEAQGQNRRSLLADGVHPNADGHAWIGKMLAEALQNAQ